MIIDRRALLISVRDYSSLEDLSGPEDHCEYLQSALNGAGWKNVTRVEQGRQTHIQLKNAIREFCGALEPDTGALIYFSGHGMSDEGGLRLMPIDGRAASDGIPVSEILSQSQGTRYLVLLLDCGNAGAMPAGVFDQVTGSLGILCSTSPKGRGAVENRRGLLATYFVEALEELARSDAASILLHAKHLMTKAQESACLYLREGPVGFNLSIASTRPTTPTEGPAPHDAGPEVTAAPSPSNRGARRLPKKSPERVERTGAGRGAQEHIEAVPIHSQSLHDVLNDLRFVSERSEHPLCKRFLISWKQHRENDSLSIHSASLVACPTLIGASVDNSTDDAGTLYLDNLNAGLEWQYRLRAETPPIKGGGLDSLWIQTHADGISIKLVGYTPEADRTTRTMIRYIYSERSPT